MTARTEAEIRQIQPQIEAWLSQRGLELNAEKTKIVEVEQGFNFLGFHIRQFRDGCFTVPQKAKVLAFLQEIRKWLIAHQAVAPEAIISPQSHPQRLEQLLQTWCQQTGVWLRGLRDLEDALEMVTQATLEQRQALGCPEILFGSTG